MTKFKTTLRGFTLVELLTVMAVIAILAAITLQVSGLVQKKAATAKAEGEIRQMEVACESYKSDNGIYPRDANTTDKLDARTVGTPGSYQTQSKYLYGELSGDKNFDGQVTRDDDLTGGGTTVPKSYLEFKPEQLGWTNQSAHTGPVLFIMDPWGNSYGYSTYYAADVEKAPATTPTHGYNPTFDLWSTAGQSKPPTPSVPASDVTAQWVKNW